MRLAEATQPFAAKDVTAQVNLGADGRLMIPAAVRDVAGIKRGEGVILRVEDDKIVLEGWATAIKRIQDMLAPMRKPGVSIVDEFLAERRDVWREDE